MTTLEMRCLGGLSFGRDGLPITDLKSSKGQALLCYLAVSGKRFTRSALAGIFWTDMPEADALMNLRKVLNRLKPFSAHLLIDHETLAFNHNAPYWLDVKEFEAAVAERSNFQRIQDAVALYQGDFLDGVDTEEIPLFSDWVDSQRNRYREAVIDSLQALIQHLRDQNDYPAAIHFTRHLLKIEPWNEEAHRELMRLLNLSGQSSEAIQQYEMCRRILKEEMGFEPALATIHLYQQIIADKLGGKETSVAQVTSHKPSAPPHNLPSQITSFVGRQKEIGELRLLLRKKETRLVTLTGSGGTGKTRLALRVAVELLDAFPDGVRMVDLAALVDSALVPQTVLAALDQIEQAGKTPVAQLAENLREKQILLILDNCEHVVTACAELTDGLLHSAPKLTILATSREILGLAGEIAYRVPPLSLPAADHLPPAEELSSYDAVCLFVDRARAADPSFALTPENAAAVVQITQSLDGIPLAIELAAARLRLLSVGQIALRLKDAFHLLTGGSRTAVPRHQTLQALIDWSYHLLSEGECSLLYRLSAFAGGWTVEAAEEVCGGATDVLDLLGKLADKSLVLAEPISGGEMRYRMLETVRQYAHTRLVDAGKTQVESMRGLHLVYYLRLAERLEPKLRGREQIGTLDELGRELDNLRQALEWGLQADIEAELRLAASLQWFWHIRYRWTEGIAWLERGLEAEAHSRGGLPPAGPRALVRAKALTALGLHRTMRDQPATATRIPPLEEAISLYRASGPQGRRGLGWPLVWLAACKNDQSETIQARRLADEALRLFLESGDPHGMAESLQCLGDSETDPVRQKKLFQEQLAIQEDNGDIEGIANAVNGVGLTGFLDGDYAGAMTAFAAGREHYRQVGNPNMVALNGFALAGAAHLSGALQRASQYLEEALADYKELANDGWIGLCLFWKGMLAIAQGRYDQAAEISEEIGHLAQKTGDPVMVTDVLYLRARLARLRGDAGAARRYAEEGMQAAPEPRPRKMLILQELGYLALQDGDWMRAGALWREGCQQLIRWINSDRFMMGFPLDGLGVLAFREGKLERAARLFGTRLWRGTFHTLSPSERLEREAIFGELRAALDAARFEQLHEEGWALTFMQVLALAQEE